MIKEAKAKGLNVSCAACGSSFGDDGRKGKFDTDLKYHH
jgi:hypothetical protein